MAMQKKTFGANEATTNVKEVEETAAAETITVAPAKNEGPKNMMKKRERERLVPSLSLFHLLNNFCFCCFWSDIQYGMVCIQKKRQELHRQHATRCTWSGSVVVIFLLPSFIFWWMWEYGIKNQQNSKKWNNTKVLRYSKKWDSDSWIFHVQTISLDGWMNRINRSIAWCDEVDLFTVITSMWLVWTKPSNNSNKHSSP